MEKFGTFMYGAVGYIVGAALLVGGWWLSMLNISIDRYQGSDFTNFWTLLGLALIFLGAYMPPIVVKLRSRKVARRHTAHEAGEVAGSAPAAPVAIAPEAAGPSFESMDTQQFNPEPISDAPDAPPAPPLPPAPR